MTGSNSNKDNTNEQPKNKHESNTQFCDRCGDEYESYMYAVQNNFSEIVQDLRSDYENLCKPCRASEHPKQAFAGADRVQPKKDAT